MNYWLLKSEPHVFSIADLKQRPGRREPWDGVRNHQAKRFLQAMAVGDLAFFYHSNAKPSAIVGIVRISRGAEPDPSQFRPESAYFEPRARPEKPLWFQVEVAWQCDLARPLPLAQLKAESALADMALLRQSRLSVSPVRPEEWQHILRLAQLDEWSSNEQGITGTD